MLEPITPWEQDLWPVFDRLKAALDRQEIARAEGQRHLSDFLSAARPLFDFLEYLTWRAWEFDKVQAEFVYLNWKRSRQIDQWVPDRDLPLRWRLAERAMLPLPPAAYVEKIKQKHAQWAQSCKDAEKQAKATYRKMTQAAKRAAKQAAKQKEKADGTLRKRG